MRLADPIEPGVLESAAKTTMKRYPYFCVELRKRGTEYYYAYNPRPVAVIHSEAGAELNSEETNFHLIAFSWYDDWITMDVFHGLTDGTGAYEVIRTLLWYYCRARYCTDLPADGVRLFGDTIPQEEWDDPIRTLAYEASSLQKRAPALDLIHKGALESDGEQTVISISVPEKAFMKFSRDNDGSPGTMVSLFLARAIHGMYPEAEDPIRISLCVNQRKALRAPLAHQSLVGSVLLEYKQAMQSWPLSMQATAMRGMTILGTDEDAVLGGAARQKANALRYITLASDAKRRELAESESAAMLRSQTATVSYVGKAGYGWMERYIKDFRTFALGEVPLLIEISAVNGWFSLDFIQHFSSFIYADAFLEELRRNGIDYHIRAVKKLGIPNVRLPWSMPASVENIQK